MDNLEEQKADELIGGNADSNNYTLEMMLAEFGDLIDENALTQGGTAKQSAGLKNHDAKLRLFEDLNLDWCVANRFEYAGINTVSDLFGLTVDNLLSLEGIGEAAIEELENCLRDNTLPAIESLAYYCPVHNSDHENLPTTADNFRSFSTDVNLDFVEGPSVFFSMDNWKQHFLCDFSFLGDRQEDIENKWADKSIGDIPGLFELIPYPDCIYLSVHESASAILSSSLEHLITDFGFKAAASIVDNLIQNI